MASRDSAAFSPLRKRKMDQYASQQYERHKHTSKREEAENSLLRESYHCFAVLLYGQSVFTRGTIETSQRRDLSAFWRAKVSLLGPRRPAISEGLVCVLQSPSKPSP